MRNVSDEVVEKVKIYILCSEFCFEKFSAYEVMWKDVVQPDRPQMTM
jgi:hypothetical protein